MNPPLRARNQLRSVSVRDREIGIRNGAVLRHRRQLPVPHSIRPPGQQKYRRDHGGGCGQRGSGLRPYDRVFPDPVHAVPPPNAFFSPYRTMLLSMPVCNTAGRGTNMEFRTPDMEKCSAVAFARLPSRGCLRSVVFARLPPPAFAEAPNARFASFLTLSPSLNQPFPGCILILSPSLNQPPNRRRAAFRPYPFRSTGTRFNRVAVRRLARASAQPETIMDAEPIFILKYEHLFGILDVQNDATEWRRRCSYKRLRFGFPEFPSRNALNG